MNSSSTMTYNNIDKRRGVVGAAAIAALLLSFTPAKAVPGAGPADGTMLGVIVRATAEGASLAADAVVKAGGEIGQMLPIIDGFSARIPATAIGHLTKRPDVLGVTPDRPIRPSQLTLTPEDPGVAPCSLCADVPATTYPLADGAVDSGAMSTVTRVVGAQDLWAAGVTGKGVDVALIDTGVTPVPGLNASRVVDGPDISFDSQSGTLYLDQYGHGTHMAGIIAGRDDDATADGTGCTTCYNKSGYSDSTKFVGVAPEARIVNVKVGAFDGAADVSQVIAAIDWVVQHRRSSGLNIRVLNLSFGTDSTQDYRLDPLSYAVEVAWRKGIFVVAASGNDGLATESLAMPAANPFVMAVGAQDPRSTLNTKDDTVPEWSQRGTIFRKIDVVAPGVSVASLDVPDSFVNHEYETVHVGRFLRGSGTSQAAAVASGVAALMAQRYPTATPGQIKKLLVTHAKPMPAEFAGYRMLDAASAAQMKVVPTAPLQPFEASTGTGSLELSRGTMHVYHEDEPLTGEQDIFGTPWDGQRWSQEAWNETSWNDGYWNGQRWSGSGWNGQRWSGTSWSADMWNGQRWSGQRWSDMTWNGQRWSGEGWNGQRWSGQRWSGQRWSGQRWSGQRWSDHSWS